VWRLILALFLGAIMPVEGTEGLSLVLTNKVGNRAISELGAVWTPWPNDLWTIVKGYPGECPRVETWSDHHFYYPYPVSIEGGHRSEIEYTTDGNEAFNLTDDSVCFRWRPPVNDGDADYYASFGLADGSTDILVEILAGAGGDPSLTKRSPDPTKPTGISNGQDAKWDPSGTYLALAHWGGNNLTIYKWDGSSLTKLADPPAPEGGSNSVAWDPTGTYLAVGHYAGVSTERFSWYKRTGDTFAELSAPASKPTSDVWGLDWDSTGAYLLVGQYASGGVALRVYSRSGDTLTEVSPQPTQPGSDVLGVAFTPDDGYAAVIHWDGPDFLSIYSHSGGSLTKLSDPATPPEGEPWDLAWDPTGTYLAVGHYTYGTSCISIYKRSGGTLTKLSFDWEPVGSYGIYGVAWSPDGTHLVVGHDGTNGIGWIERSGDTFTVLTDPGAAGGYGWRLDFRPGDGSPVVLAQDGGNDVSAYDYESGAGGTQLKITVDANTPVVVSPYSTTTHRWLRISHTSSGDVIVVETAGTDCSGWTERASLPLASGNVINALAITVNAWSDHNVADAGAPDPGYYGPFGPLGEELYLTLTNAVQTIYQEGEDGLIFTLTNEVGDY